MAESSEAPQERSQYHHFIPRFILRNYSHPGVQTNDRRKQRGNHKKGSSRPAEPVLYGINLSGNDPVLTQTTVAKTFGMMDMYRDLKSATKQHQVEEQLSVLESRAGEIISNIRKAFEAGCKDVWMTRMQRNTLRKFIFIMKYRGSVFYRRYSHENAEDYIQDDRERMMQYMKNKGIKRPVDVWFDNIKVILDLKMDHKMEWMDKLRKRIYPDDAEWCINNMQSFYMAFVTPSDKDDEFLLTQNAYSIFEGASSMKPGPVAGKLELTAYTEFHLFAPISPRLLIVLRTFMLTVPAEDTPDITEEREFFLKMTMASHVNPEAIGSTLTDLPITKAQNSYTKVVDGKMVLIGNGPTGMLDRFNFLFSPISDVHVQKINKIMLDECHTVDLLVYHNKLATIKTLGKYVAGEMHSPVSPESSRRQCLMKLQKALELLIATLPKETVPKLPHGAVFREEDLPEDKLHALVLQNEVAKGMYFKISGKLELDKKDFDQARGMLYMRIRTDTVNRHLPGTAREGMRKKFNTDNIYSNVFPTQVIWLYVKRIRFMKNGGSMIGKQGMLEDSVLLPKYLYGAEDVIAGSRALIRETELRRLMFHASANEMLLAKPLWGLVSALTLDESGITRLHEEKELVLGDQGSICDCGILPIEKASKGIRTRVLQGLQPNKSTHIWQILDGICTKDEKTETHTRELFHVLPRGMLVEDAELERVIYDVVFPAFGSRGKRKVVQTAKDEEETQKDNCLMQ
ncbi:hypothetical protein VTL71DRAFT_6592 [Oculimacula yallundae]|uniref:DUF4238 domain-containing protein n=1 Tax=Oculimacula yallundae TaxID=86028 RepID=A0ABR4BYY3_9HELO